jgi:pyruvate/2-oxoglutarate dehydrogenase complex dihydrolipoamide acyltransferase (E2) component
MTPSHASAIKRLQQSWNQAPHIVQMIHVDANRLIAVRNKIRAGQTTGTLNDVFIHAAAALLSEFPDLNVYIDGNNIVSSPTVDINIAVSTDRGLRTPSLVDLGDKSFWEIAALSERAIQGAKAGPSTSKRGSLTISNLGKYGIAFATPVLNLDEAILIFIGAIEDEVVADAGQIKICPRVWISLAFDHRITDGLRAAEFSAAYRKRLETFE